jgi:cyclopropane fatty-acyl-phospholipid synthase-like methyltransferase
VRHSADLDVQDESVSPTFSPPHADLTFMAPLSEERAARLVAFLAAGLPGTVLDIGCGWAALLLRVLEAVPDAIGEGVDLDADAIAYGHAAAGELGLADRVDLRVNDARELQGGWDAVICIGASQVWGAPVEEAQPLPYAAALAALRALVPRGGRVVYGDGIWSRSPTPEAIAPLAGREDEFVTLGELAELAVAAGFAPLAVHEAGLDEWDVFESRYAAGYARWLAEHDPDDPEADEVRGLAERQRGAYFSGYRGILGLGYLELLAV